MMMINLIVRLTIRWSSMRSREGEGKGNVQGGGGGGLQRVRGVGGWWTTTGEREGPAARPRLQRATVTGGEGLQ